ncbi:glycosyltransferase family 8 protein [Nocardioides speluncae]|uniref:glycosyltransferase family 8 protein n=1 Tax=Nocardioides speluncae TaxID=2670337 RepID=UPI00137A43A2|nr:glycosyltransferase [Nocardioides speluncae]
MPKPSPRGAAARLLRAGRRRRHDASAHASNNTSAKPSNQPSATAAADDAPRFNEPYWKTGRRLIGHAAMPASPKEMVWSNKLNSAVVTAAGRAKGLSVYAEELARGSSSLVAQARATRLLITHNQRHTARALGEGIGTEEAHHLGNALVSHAMKNFESAWGRFSRFEPAQLAELAPVEAVQCALFVGTPEAVAVARAVAERPADLGTRDLVELAGRFLVTGNQDLAKTLVEEAETRPADELDRVEDGDDFTARDILENVRRWSHPAPSTAAPAKEGTVNVAVIDYYQPDLSRASRNVGDYVQTLSMLGNLARFQKARFTGDQGLGELASLLQTRVRPELQHQDGGDADVNLLTISRDYSEGDDLPENTWGIAFGWHMHSMYLLRYGLPYHPNLNPLFISFHINMIKLLTPEAIEYLKAHGPIGCRDWTTVDVLLSAGVDAFFTGCLTTTVNAVFPPLEDVDRDPEGVVLAIDSPAKKIKANRPVEFMTNKDPKYRAVGLVEGTRMAIDILEDYQKRVHRIVTSRLHAYLPATSLGLQVNFKPGKIGDVRFDGLLDMTPEAPAFAAIRDGIRELIASSFNLILDGKSSDEVYAHWREVTAPLVAEAKARHEARLPADPDAIDLNIEGMVKQVQAGATTYGPHDKVDAAKVTDVALALDQNLKQHFPTTLESLIENASGPLRLWILARGLDADYQKWIAAAWPEVPMTFLNFDGIEYGDITRMIPHITVSTMDRLVLPDLLPDLNRITYVDIDTVTEGDVCELHNVDLKGLPLAARTSVYSVTDQWRTAGNLLSAQKASDLRRTMSAKFDYDFDNFNAGVLVLDLQRMREDKFVETYLPLVGRFGLHDQDILIMYVGPNRVELDEKWNALPVLQEIVEPGIVHYAGGLKPWSDELTPYREHWQKYAAQVAARAGEPPA